MLLNNYEELQEEIKNRYVKFYYEILKHKKIQLLIKRSFDFIGAIVGSILLAPIILAISIIVKIDSTGPIFFKQIRITQYGRQFNIFKFRTMVVNAQEIGAQVTSKNDPRVTTIGRFLRKYRLDELPQILNILKGDLSFVGTRPEVPRYVSCYTEEMLATLLMPAGVTSQASIEFKDEEKILSRSIDIDKEYIEKVLPVKMNYNLKYIEGFTIIEDIKIIIKTIGVMLGLNINK